MDDSTGINTCSAFEIFCLFIRCLYIIMKTVVLCLYILCPSDMKLCTGTSTRVLCRSYYHWMVMQALAVCAARRSQMNSQASRRCGLAMSPLSTGSSAKLFGFLGIHDTTGTVCFERSFDITEAGSRRVVLLLRCEKIAVRWKGWAVPTQTWL